MTKSAEPEIIDVEVEAPQGGFKRKSSSIWLIVGAVALALLVGAVASGIIPTGIAPPGVFTPDLTAEWGIVKGVKPRQGAAPEVAAPAAPLEPTPVAVAATAQPQASASPVVEPDIGEKLARLNADLEALRSELQSGVQTAKSVAEAPNASLAVLSERVAALESGLANAESRMQVADRLLTITLSLSELRAELASTDGFGAELDRLAFALAGAGEIGAPAIQALSALSPYASKGAPTLAELQSRFRAVPKAVLLAGAGTHSGWWPSIQRWLAGLITVRRLGEVEGDTAEAIVARAETRLGAENLAGALTELEKLSGAQAVAAADWIEAANARLAAERTLHEIETWVQDQRSRRDFSAGSSSSPFNGSK
jgi:hypothetical protein